MGVAVPLILLTVLTAGAMLFTPPRARAWSTLLALMLAPAGTKRFPMSAAGKMVN